MNTKDSKSNSPPGAKIKKEKFNQIVSNARKAQSDREKGYREKSLKIHPWICARCGREFTNKNLHLLTVHHKDHNHDNNPPDGSNWENLCIYCHENEHTRYLDHLEGGHAEDTETNRLTHNPFASLKNLIDKEED